MRVLLRLIHLRVEKLMALVTHTVRSMVKKKAKRVLSEVNIILKMSLTRRSSHGKSILLSPVSQDQSLSTELSSVQLKDL